MLFFDKTTSLQAVQKIANIADLLEIGLFDIAKDFYVCGSTEYRVLRKLGKSELGPILS